MNNSLKNDGKHLPPRLVVSAPQGHSGKTIVSIGLCAAYKQRGLVVQPFKKGPDYIDPSWLAAASGRDCRNLDTILMPEDTVLASFSSACCEADIAIIEGAMGLYDSLNSDGTGSTAYISRLLKSPVILIVNAARMTRSAAALVKGFQHFEQGTNIAGVILNNISGSRHEQKIISAIEQNCGIPVVGSLPRDSMLNISERHLGLVPYPEIGESAAIERIREYIKQNINLDSIINIAGYAGELDNTAVALVANEAKQVKIGIVSDSVFSFYYPENLAALEQAGAELVFINSLLDKNLPDIDALYIGGGFPEMFLPELEANIQLRYDIYQAIENYLPVYAECAGLMYLCRSISWQGKPYQMVGTIPADVELCSKPRGHGYVKVEVVKENPFFPVGSAFWGHEFHHSRISTSANLKMAYQVLRGTGINKQGDGIVYKNVFASYLHLHALSVPEWSTSFYKQALIFKQQHSLLLTKS